MRHRLVEARRMTWLALASAALLTLVAGSAAAADTVAWQGCEDDLRNVVKRDVDCTITVTPDAELDGQIKAATGGLIRDANCEVPVSFRKQEIYGEWIADDRVEVPAVRVSCQVGGITDENGQALTVRTDLGSSCVKRDGAWSCWLNMRNTEGLGPLSKALEKLVHESPDVRAAVTDFFTGRLGER